MPTYDYKCMDCGYRFDYFQKISDEPLTVCPECGGKLKRLVGAGLTPIFKGSGFYQTDYKNNGNGKKTSVVNKNNNGSKKAVGQNSNSKTEK